MSSDQHAPESASTGQVQRPGPDRAAEALRQIAREMSKAYEVALEVDPQLYFSGRTPALATSPSLADRAR
ncbi:hypothetical protein Q2K19_16895 [Micromonospora soli]|uniref:hypothetical protein n=1 Tax=Micromonospora sp. NBRC 110009 TaxID=3061627 RepID=UPI002673D5BB|nr:hypothetical protein [Micromonospora sp. NBRC 110009]WKU02026.1 hypothetical protein Q2K19_16895 [Micromonospora sp. NBRC 110009]